LWRNTSQTEGRTNNNEPSSPSLIKPLFIFCLEIRSSRIGACLHHHEILSSRWSPSPPPGRSRSAYDVRSSGALSAARSSSHSHRSTAGRSTSDNTKGLFASMGFNPAGIIDISRNLW
jgi:hypothetical protein